MAAGTRRSRRAERDDTQFKKSLATLIDDEGLSARIGADHLGHTNDLDDSGQVHERAGASTPQVADMLDRVAGINDE